MTCIMITLIQKPHTKLAGQLRSLRRCAPREVRYGNGDSTFICAIKRGNRKFLYDTQDEIVWKWEIATPRTGYKCGEIFYLLNIFTRNIHFLARFAMTRSAALLARLVMAAGAPP